MTITGSQCRAARALIEWPRELLARNAGIAIDVIDAFERRLQELDAETRGRLQHALEAGGAVFTNENGGNIGVRLKFSRADERRIATLEGEGGAVASDDVP